MNADERRVTPHTAIGPSLKKMADNIIFAMACHPATWAGIIHQIIRWIIRL
jgi:hypothetical protein